MSVISLLGLLIAFLLSIILAVLLARFVTFSIRRSRKKVYAYVLGYTVSNWVTLAILLIFVFPEIGLSLTSIGFREAISLGEIGLALVFAFISICWFALSARLRIFKTKIEDYRIDNWKHIAILSLYAPIIAAFCEEFFYRGFAITVLNAELGNIWIAV